MTRPGRAQRPMRRKRFGRPGQALVEFAILLPTLVIITLGGVALNSAIQGQSLMQQAVNHAALVGARDAYDPCLPNDEQGFALTPAPNAHLPGYLDVYYAFWNVLNSSTLFTNPGQIPTNFSPANAAQAPPNAAPLGQVSISCSNSQATCALPPPAYSCPVQSWNPVSMQSWSNTNPNPATGLTDCFQGGGSRTAGVGVPFDNGCHKMWAGGVITVSVTVNLKLPWSPLTQFVKLTATAAEQIEPFRQHSCTPGIAPC
jgi:hypothetical protein